MNNYLQEKLEHKLHQNTICLKKGTNDSSNDTQHHSTKVSACPTLYNSLSSHSRFLSEISTINLSTSTVSQLDGKYILENITSS